MTLDSQNAECKVWKKKKKEKKRKGKKNHSTFFDTDLFYFPLVEVVTGSLH